MSDNILSIDAIRIDRNKPRKCVCEDVKFSIDTTNRQITCECGFVHDPFEALMHIARHYDEINEQHKRLYEQHVQWKKEKPHSVLFKGLERHYSRGTMLPSCPKCKQMFDFKDIDFWSNAEFYRKLEQRQAILDI